MLRLSDCHLHHTASDTMSLLNLLPQVGIPILTALLFPPVAIPILTNLTTLLFLPFTSRYPYRCPVPQLKILIVSPTSPTNSSILLPKSSCTHLFTHASIYTKPSCHSPTEFEPYQFQVLPYALYPIHTVQHALLNLSYYTKPW